MKSFKSDANVKYHRGGLAMSKFKVGDKIKVVSVENYKMIDMLGEVFTVSHILNKGNYFVEENEWVWSEYNLELVEETVVDDVQNTIKVWELEEGKEYQEIVEHTKNIKFRIYNDELQYTFWNDCYNEIEDTTLGEILTYKFIEIKSKLEQEIDKLLQTYSKDEIVQVVNKLYK